VDYISIFSKWLTEKKAVILLIITGSLVYFNGLFATFAWDDYDQVLNNIPVHSITNIFTFFLGGNVYTGTSKLFGIYYRPVMSTMFALIYTVFGPNPVFFHLVQIVIHISNGILVFFILKRFFPKVSAFFASLVFLIHPINTEAVIFVSTLQDTLFMFFGLLALRLVLVKKITPLPAVELALFLLLSILSKETGILFFALIPIYKLIFDKKGLGKLIGTEAIALSIYLILRFFIAGIDVTTHGNATIMQISPPERLLTMAKIFSYYFLTFFYPKDLAIAQVWVVRSPTFFDFYLPLFFDLVIIMFGVLAYFWLKKVKGDLKIFYFFVSWLTIGIIFHLQIIPLDMTVAERWFYFPIVGLLGIFCLLIQNLHLKKGSIRITLSYLLLLVLVGLAIRTVIRNSDWSNELKLYLHDAQISKNSVFLEENIGTEYYKLNELDLAQTYFLKASELEPGIPVAWYNLAVIAGRKGKFNLAKTYYQKAIDTGGYTQAYENLAIISYAYGPLTEAEKDTRAGLQVLPDDPKLWLIYALVENKLKKHNEALLAAKNAYILSPNSYTSGIYNAINQNMPVHDPKIDFE
jgi:hypothetical protein